MVRTLLPAVILALSCGQPPREFRADVAIGNSGVSDSMAFVVPPRTRSITVTVAGLDDALFGLGELTDAKGVDHVRLPAGIDLETEMRERFFVEWVALMPGDLVQMMRLGSFTSVFPQRPDQAVVDGQWRLRVASGRAGLRAAVHVLLATEEGARVVHCNLVPLSDEAARSPLEVIPEVNRIFAQAGLEVVVDEVVPLLGTPFDRIEEDLATLPGPQSEPARLATLARGQVATDALNVFIVDAFAHPAFRGFSLGLPGAPELSDYYWGVLVRADLPVALRARVMAHEVAHFLALQHVENLGTSGRRFPDGLDDTEPGRGNLMDVGDGTVITPQQVFALSRSALLSK